MDVEKFKEMLEDTKAELRELDLEHEKSVEEFLTKRFDIESRILRLQRKIYN